MASTPLPNWDALTELLIELLLDYEWIESLKQIVIIVTVYNYDYHNLLNYSYNWFIPKYGASPFSGNQLP